MNKFSDLLYEQQVELHEALAGEPTAEEFDDIDSPGSKIQARGFNYYNDFNPKNGEDEDIFNKKGTFVNELIKFYNKWIHGAKIEKLKTDPDVSRILDGYNKMCRSITKKT